jgi:hypothetical protein
VIRGKSNEIRLVRDAAPDPDPASAAQLTPLAGLGIPVVSEAKAGSIPAILMAILPLGFVPVRSRR